MLLETSPWYFVTATASLMFPTVDLHTLYVTLALHLALYLVCT